MKIDRFIFALPLLILSLTQLGMARNAQYDEEARQQEKAQKQMDKSEKSGSRLAQAPKNILSGVKQATVDSTAGFISETAAETRNSAPVIGTVEGARQGTEAFLDNTVKGVSKVATLGYGEVDHIDVVEPEDNSGDTTKIKIKF